MVVTAVSVFMLSHILCGFILQIIESRALSGNGSGRHAKEITVYYTCIENAGWAIHDQIIQ